MDTDKNKLLYGLSVTSVSSAALPRPSPRAPISVRIGTRDDIPFIDALQKQHRKALGFFPRAQLEGYIDNGWVLIAEDAAKPLGYVASRDRYLKRDELGVIYQLCVSPSAQRGLIGASLIKAVFERSAYGCRLYCCWCAQDLAANRFWESLGFQPIAFRGGSAKKSRTHIFWQKRTRANDHVTPWWFPAKTDGGAMREDRLVLPIPPALAWSDAMPVLEAPAPTLLDDGVKPTGAAGQRKRSSEPKALPEAPTPRPQSSMQFGPPRLKLKAPPIVRVDGVAQEALPIERSKPKRATSKCESSKCDPKLIAAARELRDRWLERMNRDGVDQAAAKYDVSRRLEDQEHLTTVRVTQRPSLALPSSIAA